MSGQLTTPKQLVAAYEKYGSLKAAGRKTNTGWGTVHRLYMQALAEGLMEKLPRGAKNMAHITNQVKGKVKAKKPKITGRRRVRRIVKVEHKKRGVTRFLFTCAQNNTKLHEQFWNNLLVLKDHYDAALHVSRFSYIKNGLGARGDKKHWLDEMTGYGRNGTIQQEDFAFDPRINDYVSDDPLQIAGGLIWRGDYNILPTAARPLSGLKTVTGRKSGIFPHVKIALESIPSMEHDAVKFNYTTGTVTERNYIGRKEGLKAEFHHTYGALLVEVDANGDWWCRQINADSEGTIYDLDICVKKGVLTTGNRVEALTVGDVHDTWIDESAKGATWGEGGIVDFLRPKHQFIHDLLDMYARSHHEIDDPHQLYLRYILGKDSVSKEIAGSADFLSYSHRDFMKTHVVNSNHDRALMKWLKNHTAMKDPVNYEIWTDLNQRVKDQIKVTGDFPVVLREAYLYVCGAVKEPAWLHFMAQDEQFIVCPDKGGGVEHGEHGDNGPNGARGSTAGYAQLGRKITKGHSHVAEIMDGVHSVGCTRLLKTGNAGYTHGPSSWSHTHGIDYANGKRTLVTIWHGRPWAPR